MDETAQRTDEVPVPTAKQVLVRALPAAAVMVVSLPLATWWLVEASSDGGPWWGWLLMLAATVGLSAIVQRCTSPPRPRVDQRIGQAQWASATTTAAKTGELPACPKVRIAVGVAACAGIEGLIGSAALLAAMAFSALVFPDLWTAVVPVAVMTGITAYYVRRSWAYLRALHAAERTD